MPDITDYDSSGYDYTKYWKARDYENAIEQRTLRRTLPKHGRHILDVGGGFGRLTEIYYPRFDRSTIFDYSKNSLKQVQSTQKQKGWTNLNTVAGDLYHLPFADASFDCVIMIRVLHHLEQPRLAIAELARVLEPGGVLILEMANKIHLKATLKAWLTGHLRFRSDLAPVQRATINNQQSTINRKPETKQAGIFYNFHPRYIQQLLESHHFVVEQKRSVSNLRLPLLKKIFPVLVLESLDTALQPFFTLIDGGPSIWFKCQKIR